MRQQTTVLARYDNFGSVTCCPHGSVQVQLGHTISVLSEEQYLRFVAMLSDSAASYEFFREANRTAQSGETAHNG